MPTRNVVLTDHQSALLDRLVASGRFQNASEAMRAGLRMLEEDEERRRALSEYFDAVLADPLAHDILDEDAETVIHGAFAEAMARWEKANEG